MMSRHLGVLALIGAMMAASARADLRLPRIFSDNMVLQQDAPVPVWGWAAPGETIKVRFADQQKSATAGADGKWLVTLDAIGAGGPLEMNIEGASAITIRNVLVGEVWFCSGQSNMEWPVEKAMNAEAEMASADLPQIRHFRAKSVVKGEEQDDVEGRWEVCSPQTVRSFTAVGFFFAREINRARRVSVGIINSSAGWTPGEAWMSREALLAEPDLRYIVERWDAVVALKPGYDREIIWRMKRWEEESAKARAEGRSEPSKPKGPIDPNFVHRASGLWNGSVAPLAPYAMRGVLWYQGETNDNRGYQYRRLFPALINCWRQAWGRADMPFLFVQLANVLPPDPQPAESEWAEVREAQSMALSLPETAMAVTIDIGEATDVHPRNKQEVGRRLALCARAKVYGEAIEYSGPVYKGMSVQEGRIILRFDHAKGLAGKDGASLKGFAIAGVDRRFVPAQARIEGQSIVVWSNDVPGPVAVRYAWANNPEGCNLVNEAGLPASPFRTDDWPGKSLGNTRLTIDDM